MKLNEEYQLKMKNTSVIHDISLSYLQEVQNRNTLSGN